MSVGDRLLNPDSEGYATFEVTNEGVTNGRKQAALLVKQVSDDGDTLGAATLAVAADIDTPAANTDATVTYAAVAGEAHVISGVIWSYNAAPTGGTLHVKRGTTIVRAINITNEGPGFISFNRPIKGAPNEALSIVLLAGGGGVSGIVQAEAHWTETE